MNKKKTFDPQIKQFSDQYMNDWQTKKYYYPGTWYPIETAPIDGTDIDIWHVDEEFGECRITDVSFREPTESEFWCNGSIKPSQEQRENGVIGLESRWFDCHGIPYNPTHWMPIPPGPRLK